MNKHECISLEEKARKEQEVRRVVNSVVVFLLYLFSYTPVYAEGGSAITLTPVTSLVLSLVSSIVTMLAVIKAAQEWQNGSTVKMIVAIVVGMFLFWFASSPETVLNKGNEVFSGIFGG
jgi:cation transport ATPase